jgi:hypothetical protein
MTTFIEVLWLILGVPLLQNNAYVAKRLNEKAQSATWLSFACRARLDAGAA